MIRRWLPLVLALLLLFVSARAEPLVFGDDLTGSRMATLRPEAPESPVYDSSCRSPHIVTEDVSAGVINQYYQVLMDQALSFDVPMMADYYSSDPEITEDIRESVTYSITCNNDDYLGVLIRTEGMDFNTFQAHTFSRLNLRAGSSVTLPYLLGILDSGEENTWLQDRQTAKANNLVRGMVWERILDRGKEIPFYEGLTREFLDYSFFPEEDFYLDESGEPVFFLNPGVAAEVSAGMITFPITLEEILDEM